ncbi:MAG: hypothetical protein K6F48_04005 [Paludibacteraceae bacterium]|nr:hypothetical protein [Paludibacteraceae bacterium]
MKKILILTVILFSVVFTGCKNVYEKYSSSEFSIEYPKAWAAEYDRRPTCPFVASNDNQIVVVNTREMSDISVEDFAKSRVVAFSEEMEGFNLIKFDMENDYALIHYSSEDEEIPDSYQETIMKIGKKGNKLYGVDCSFVNNAQKDTVEHIINSFQLK